VIGTAVLAPNVDLTLEMSDGKSPCSGSSACMSGNVVSPTFGARPFELAIDGSGVADGPDGRG